MFMENEIVEMSGLPTLTLFENTFGRDFIIGDLHGCLDLLLEKMKMVDFDKKVDRLFCTGDLIDRGPKSLECIELLYEPWFYATRGNHEQMYLTWLSGGYSSYHNSRDFYRNGGAWAYDLDAQMMKEFSRVIQEKMPFIINVGAEDGFYVAHSFLDEETLNFSEDGFVWNRRIFKNVSKDLDIDELLKLPPLSFIKISEVTSKLTYVGHNTVKHKMLIDNNLLIDTGAYKKVVESDNDFDLTILEHKPTLQLLLEMPVYGQEETGTEEAVQEV